MCRSPKLVARLCSDLSLHPTAAGTLRPVSYVVACPAPPYNSCDPTSPPCVGGRITSRAAARPAQLPLVAACRSSLPILQPRSFGYPDLSGLKERILDDDYIELDDDLCTELIECADSDPPSVKKLLEKHSMRAESREDDQNERSAFELKSLFTSLCSEDPREIHQGKISSILLPHIRYFAYYIARGVLDRDNTSNISALDLAILAAALLGHNTYNIGALIARRLVVNSGKGPHFGGIYATLILEHLRRTVRTDDTPFSFIIFDLTAMKRHEFVTRTSEFGNLVYIMRFGELTTREIRPPAPLLFDYTSRNGWSLTSIELDEFGIQQKFHIPMEDVVHEEEEPSPWEASRASRLDVIENKVATIELIENLDKKIHNQITQYVSKVGMVLKNLKEKEPTVNIEPVPYRFQYELAPSSFPALLRNVWFRLYPHGEEPVYQVLRKQLAKSVYKYHAHAYLVASSDIGSYSRSNKGGTDSTPELAIQFATMEALTDSRFHEVEMQTHLGFFHYPTQSPSRGRVIFAHVDPTCDRATDVLSRYMNACYLMIVSLAEEL
ncbi:Far1 [Hordeum vulgare]|nr:Far1 [Hordeum vulgare]